MLGQPVYMLTPEVIGFRLKGRLPEGSTATDLVLTVTEMLRKRGVVDKFVEFFGSGMGELSVPDRATIANMAPEYGATMGFFPVDAKTLDYMRLTGRDGATIELVETYCRANGLFWMPGAPEPEFTDVLELDLSTVRPSLAGPKRPQDRVLLTDVKQEFTRALTAPLGNKGLGIPADRINASGTVRHMGGTESTLRHGSVVIAAITSCTNTSNPDVMIAAGLVARKARALGLTSKPWVKTSLAPGSKVVTEYYNRAGLSEDLDAMGFQTVGYGCTTCIGNSGPLPEEVEAAVKEGDLVVASVLSGNRNFEGRVHPSVKANYLASPPLVVAYAIAGRMDVDLTTEPIAVIPSGPDVGRPVYLKDIWPTHDEVQKLKASCIGPDQFKSQYGNVFTGNPTWNAVPVSQSELYNWREESTYIQNPPFFESMTERRPGAASIRGARCLVFVGDSVTTDHISPAGDIAEKSPAGEYLKSRGVPKSMFNSYGSRRGNDRVMTRGTFANVRVRNKLAAEDGKVREGGWTRDFSGVARRSAAGGAPISWIYDAAMNYKKEGTPLIVLAGKDYGMGSSRDWAAKGTMLLGVKAVISESFERIHRSNLVGMGVLPLNFMAGQNAESLGLDGTEVFDIELPDPLEPRCEVPVTATGSDGRTINFKTLCRIDTPIEVEYYLNGGILHTVIRKKLNEQRQPAGV
jgi:aconitate hydratase